MSEQEQEVLTLESYLNQMFKPGNTILTTGDKGGGKTHTAVFLCEKFVKGEYKSMGKVILVTNVKFYHKVGGKCLENDCPDGVYYITTMKELFPIIVKSVREYGRSVRIILLLDEAQNFLNGDQNMVNTSTVMKIFLGTIRKYCLCVWFLTPSAQSIGPSFRNFINDKNYPGNLTGIVRKDMEINRAYLKNHPNARFDPKQMMIMRKYDLPPMFIRLGRSEWTNTLETAKDGQYFYDHISSGIFTVGDGFDFNDFNRVMGDVGSLRQIEAIEEYYKKYVKEEGKNDTADPVQAQEILYLKAVIGLYQFTEMSWDQIATNFGSISRQALTNKIKRYGLWTKELERKKSRNKTYQLPTEPTARQLVSKQKDGKNPPIYISKAEGPIIDVSGKINDELRLDTPPITYDIPDGKYGINELGRAIEYCKGVEQDVA